MLLKIDVNIVIPTMPPRARQLMLMVPAVPSRNDGTERPKATMGMTVVTAVPIPKSAENTHAMARRLGLTIAIKPVSC